MVALIRRAYIYYGHPHQESINLLWSPSLGGHQSTMVNLIRRAYIYYGHPHQKGIHLLWSPSLGGASIYYGDPPEKNPLNTKYIKYKIPRTYLYFTFYKRNNVRVQDKEDQLYYPIDTVFTLLKNPPPQAQVNLVHRLSSNQRFGTDMGYYIYCRYIYFGIYSS